jgi:hypothetical protein
MIAVAPCRGNGLQLVNRRRSARSINAWPKSLRMDRSPARHLRRTRTGDGAGLIGLRF